MLFGITPTLHLHSAVAAQEPGPVSLTHEPVSLFDPTYWWNFTDSSTLTFASDGSEITGCSNSGSASGGDASRENSVGPDWSDAITYAGYHKGAEIENTISGGGTAKTLEATVSITPWDEPRSYLVVWATDDALNSSGSTRCPVAFHGTDGADASVLTSSTTGDYQFMGSHLRSTNGLTQVDDIFRAALITGRAGQWNQRRITSYVSNSSSVTNGLSISQRVVDTVILGRYSSSAGRTLRGYLFEVAVFPAVLTESESNSLMRALCYKYSGNSAAQSTQSSLPVTWVDSDWSTAHASLSHPPYAYIDNQTNANLTTSTDAETFTVDATDTLTIASSSTVAAGDKFVASTTGTLPTGLATSADYFVHSRPTSTTIKLSSSYENVWAGTAISITSGTGSGVHTLSRTLVEKIDCDTNAVRHFDPSGSNKLTYNASSGAQVGALLGSAASSGSYSWTNASQQDDGSIIIVGRKYSSASHSARSCSVGSASGGDQYIEFGGSSGRARAKFAGVLVTCSSSFTDGELFVAYFTFKSSGSSAGHQLHVYDTSTQTWTSSSLASDSAGEVFFERWQKLGVEVGSRLELMEAIFFEDCLSDPTDLNTNNSAIASSYGFTHSATRSATSGT